MALELLRRQGMALDSSHLLHREITEKIIRAFFDTYNELGSGFPEFVCRSAVAVTLGDMGLDVIEEVHLPVYFRGRRLVKFRADILVGNVVLVEVKAQQQLERFHTAQLRNYLKASGLTVGLVLNFGPQPSFKRVVFDTARATSTESPRDDSDVATEEIR